MDTRILKAAADYLRPTLAGSEPYAALVLGSGWSAVADAFEILEEIHFADIPGLGETGVEGHAGNLRLAAFEGRQLLVFQGRRHWYEGVGWEPVALPVYVAADAGAGTLVLTNAAGGIRPGLTPGDLMVIDDHINAMGANPLAGPHDPFWGPRFPDLTEIYDQDLRELFDKAGNAADVALHHGVYLASPGPLYETPAEVCAFGRMGADAVGMSTVPEAVLAHSAGLRVAAISCITNLAAGVSPTPLSHDEVIAETQRARPRMAGVLSAFLRLLERSPSTT